MTVQSALQFLSVMEKVRVKISERKPVRFTHKLSFEEQKLLSEEEGKAYCDWLMSRPVRQCPNIDDPNYLDADYDMRASKRRYETGE